MNNFGNNFGNNFRNGFRNIFGNMNPTFLIIIAVLLIGRIGRGGFLDWFIMELYMLPGIVIGLSFHEAGHAYVSYWLGDPTPKNQGRLSLNPLAHIDPVGFLALLLCGFGWGRPVTINPFYYKKRRRDEFLVAFAGVGMNLVIAIVCALILKLVFLNMTTATVVTEILFYIVYYCMYINVVLMFFNLIPCPPLDGFGIATQIFDLTKYRWYYTLEQYGYWILMALIIFNVTSMILSPLVSGFINIIL